jgi:hypothetical protein
MQVQDLIGLFRKQVADEQAPYLWDDTEILQYIIDAQDTMVRKFGGISDYSTTALTDIAVVASAPMSSFSRYILRIRSIKLLTSLKPVRIISESDMARMDKYDYSRVAPFFLSDTDIGPVSDAIIGLEDYKLRWVRVPNLSETARMHIYRLPYPRITKQEDALEIEEQHHLALLKWVKHMAYEKEDAETYDKGLSEKNEQSFNDYCEAAAQEKGRQRYKPRVVQSNY